MNTITEECTVMNTTFKKKLKGMQLISEECKNILNRSMDNMNTSNI